MMKRIRSVRLSILFFLLFAQNALAQSPTITTYAGPPLPVNGAQATMQAVGSPRSVITDGLANSSAMTR